VWPGHLGGSLCGGPEINLKVCSTIGYEREHQELLRIDDEEEFVRRAIDGLGPQPPNFRAIVAINTGPLVRGGAHADPLTPARSSSTSATARSSSTCAPSCSSTMRTFPTRCA
jgi:hydroxyacylglutathione hydrolase